MDYYSLLAKSVIDGTHETASELTRQMLYLGFQPKEILDEGLLKGMNVVGQRFKENIIFVPQVLISARAFKVSLSLLEPFLSKTDTEGNGTVVIGTVKGDIHDIGKNIVAMMLRSSGFKVVDLGIDIRVEKYIEAIKAHQAVILGMSALLTTTMGYMKVVIDRLKQEGLQVKTIIGGAPINQAFAYQIGADGYAKNATEAIEISKNLIN
ncbi:MAG: corrinoid protein [Ignavibacteriaceae bacterium]|nr:corrinoid protein [Ignavibacteriaceae bacterium]